VLKPKKEDDRECESSNGHRGRRGGGGGISFFGFFNKRKKTVTNMRERILSNEMRIDRKIGGGVRVSSLKWN